MQNIKQIIEMEYRYLIPESKVSLRPPDEICGFKLESNTTSEHEDLLFEREKTSMKSENVGIRMRKKSNNFEYTYKKFLGRFDGVVNYDELTVPVSIGQWELALSGKIDDKVLPKVGELIQKGNIYPLFLIKNKRNIYNYVQGKSKIELVVEDVMYSIKDKTAKDYMLEAEVVVSSEDKQDLDFFIKEICDLYNCQDLNEGKNSRAEKLLGVTL